MPVLVADHGSRDRTVAIARAHGAQVTEREWPGFVRAREAALAGVQTPWTLMLDADERLDEELRADIVAARGDCAGYELLRTTYLAGKPVRIWSNEPVLRLFRTEAARVVAAPAAGGEAALHERWIVDGRVERLAGHLHHDSYATRAAYLQKFARYTEIEAASVTPSLETLLREAMLTPLRFAWYALRRGAWRDGSDGWWIAWHSAAYRCVVAKKALQR